MEIQAQRTIVPDAMERLSPSHRSTRRNREPDSFRNAAKDLSNELYASRCEPHSRRQAEIAGQQVQGLLQAWRKRDCYFGSGLFADPAWGILLALFAAEVEQRKLSVSGACISAAVSPTTGLRWLRKLERAGLIIRSADTLDRRRCWIRLSPSTTAAMQRYLSTFATGSVPL